MRREFAVKRKHMQDEAKKPVRISRLRSCITTLTKGGFTIGVPMVQEKTVIITFEIPVEATMAKKKRKPINRKPIKS